MCFAGTVVASWSLTQEVADSIPFTVMTNIFTTRKRSLGQGNMFTGVCLSTGGMVWSWGVPAWGGACSGGMPALGRCLLRRVVPAPGGACSRGVCSLGGAWWRPPGQLPLRAVHILLECILVVTEFSEFRENV